MPEISHLNFVKVNDKGDEFSFLTENRRFFKQQSKIESNTNFQQFCFKGLTLAKNEWKQRKKNIRISLQEYGWKM